jgi:lipopolysaccharide export system protein LptC
VTAQLKALHGSRVRGGVAFPAGPAPRRPGWRITGLGRLARLARLALPLMAVGLVGLLVFWANASLSQGRFHVGITDLTSSEADKFSLVNARFDGIDSKNRPFSLTAEQAGEIDAASGLIALKGLQADITLESGTWLALKAGGGMYRRKSDLLELDGGVNLFHDRGYEIRARSLRVDLDRRIASSHEPIAFQGPEGSLEAEGFRLENGGDRLVFLGHSKLIFYSGARVPDLAIE